MASFRAPANFGIQTGYRSPMVAEGAGSLESGMSGAMQAYNQQLARLLGHVDVPGLNQVGTNAFMAAPDPRMPFFMPQQNKAKAAGYAPPMVDQGTNFAPPVQENKFVSPGPNPGADFLLQALMKLFN